MVQLSQVYIQQCVINPIVVNINPAPAPTKHGGDDVPWHYRSRHNPGYDKKAAKRKREQRNAEIRDLHIAYRKLMGLPLGEYAPKIAKVAPKLVNTQAYDAEIERLKALTRGQIAEMNRLYTEYQLGIEQHNETMMKYLLEQVL